MTAAAILLALLGIGFSFFSAEISSLSGLTLTKSTELLLQLLGALYFGFAMLNWMAKGSTIGGIYNRPIAIANFAHFFVGGMALIKTVISNPQLSLAIWLLTFLYAVFAVLFALLLFRSPVGATKFSTTSRA